MKRFIFAPLAVAYSLLIVVPVMFLMLVIAIPVVGIDNELRDTVREFIDDVLRVASWVRHGEWR